MGTQNDSAAAPAHFEDRAANRIGADGVEASERFVQDQQFRLGNHGSDELNLLAHALAKGFHFIVGALREAQAFEPRVDFSGYLAPTAKLAVKFQQRADTH